MRHLIPLLLVIPSLVPASEALPLLELTGTGPVPIPAALRPAWQAALGEADAWVAENQPTEHPATAAVTATATVTATAAVSQTTSFHFTGWALPRAGEVRPAPLLTGWWQGTAAPAAAFASLATGWPGYQVTRLDERVVMTHAAAGVETAVRQSPGLSLTIHGAGLAASLAPALEHCPWLQPCFAALPGWRLQMAISPTGQTELRTGIPVASLAAVESDLVASLPPSAWAVAALGIAPDSSRGRLPPGTLAGAWLGGTNWLASLPDHPRSRELLATWLGKTITVPAASEPPAALAEAGPWLVRRGNHLLVGSTAAALTVATPGDRWWGKPNDGALGFVRLRLPETAESSTRAGMADWQDVHTAWTFDAVAAILGTTVHGITLVAGSDGVPEAVGTYAGETLPWLGPALALRWACDEVADQTGRRLLSSTMQRLAAAGIPLTRDAFLATRAPMTPAAATALRTHWRAVEDPPDSGDNAALRDAIQEASLPVTVATPKQLAAVRAFISRAMAGDLDPAANGSYAWQLLNPQEKVSGMLIPHIHAWRNLARCGEQLVLHGDARGLAAVDAAARVSAQPTCIMEASMTHAIQTIRDQAWLAACIQGLGDPTAWLAEPSPDGDTLAKGWQGETIIQAEFAQEWLDHGPDPLLLGPDRAWLAADLAQILSQAPQRQIAPLKEQAAPVLHATFITGVLSPSYARVVAQIYQRRLVHQVIRLAGRLAQVARTQELPADPGAVEKLIGQPLAIPWSSGPLPCRWQRLPDRGFRLQLDLNGPVPAGIAAEKWRTWQQKKVPGDEVAFSASETLVQVHQVVAKRTVEF